LTDQNAVAKNQTGSEILRKFGTKLCISVTMTILLLCGIELASLCAFRAAAYTSGKEFRTRSIYRKTSWADLYWREWNEARKLEYRSYIVWRRAPFAGKVISINNDGVRRTYNSECQPGAYTIWMFGSSTLWGSGSPDWDTIPSLLALKYTQSEQAVCVRNFGEETWLTTQEVVGLMLQLKQAKPDLVIFYDGAGNAFAPYQTSQGDVHANFDRIKREFDTATRVHGTLAFLQQSNTYQLLDSFLIQLQLRKALRERRQAIVANAGSLAQISVANYLANMDLVEALGARYGFRCAFFWQPLIFVEHKPLTVEEQSIMGSARDSMPGMDVLYRATYDLLRVQRRPNLFYIADVFNQTTNSLYYDALHVGPEGNQLVVARMYKILREQGL
jgi:hypothetical protein